MGFFFCEVGKEIILKSLLYYIDFISVTSTYAYVQPWSNAFIYILSSILVGLLASLRIRWLYPLLRDKTALSMKVSLVWLWTISDDEAPFMEIWGVWSRPFIIFPPSFTLTRSGNTCQSPIYHSNSIGPYTKKHFLRNNSTKNVNKNYNEPDSLTSGHKIIPDGLTYH